MQDGKAHATIALQQGAKWHLWAHGITFRPFHDNHRRCRLWTLAAGRSKRAVTKLKVHRSSPRCKSNSACDQMSVTMRLCTGCPVLSLYFSLGETEEMGSKSSVSNSASSSAWEKAQVRAMASVRVLVVDDSVPFRQYICSTLAKMDDLQVICEVADGLDAVQKAEELKPDLIVLDLGLPTLNGLEAARRILNFSSESKIVFVTQETCADVVQEALSLGAWGYVAKTRAGIDLLPAVEAVLEGRRFVSSGLTTSGPD